mgnify:CR=1 FL=1
MAIARPRAADPAAKVEEAAVVLEVHNLVTKTGYPEAEPAAPGKRPPSEAARLIEKSGTKT